MKAVVFTKNNELKLVNDYEKPIPKKGEALVRVTLAGICNTDYEITKGYMGYEGILGHEAVGVVEEVNGEDQSLVGKRVVPEISYGCKDPECPWCAEKLYRHCPDRHTLGIFRKDGVFAQYFTMPTEVLFEVPANVPDTQAVFVEPLAAALEINEQHHIRPFEKVVVLGDGKLGLITALALNAQNLDVILVGKHQNKLDIAKAQGVETALALTKPRGVLVLKSTVAASKEFNLAPIVIDEITVLGSRCGQFPAALRMLKSERIDFSPLISATYSIDDAIEGFEKNKEKDTLKVLLEFKK